MPVNLITSAALLVLVFAIAIQSGSKDEQGRSFWARASDDALDDNDRFFFKLAGGCLAVALIAFMLFG